jgi:hypothetical protein
MERLKQSMTEMPVPTILALVDRPLTPCVLGPIVAEAPIAISQPAPGMIPPVPPIVPEALQTVERQSVS